MGVIFIPRDYSAKTDCALKPLCFFFWCCTNLLLRRRKSLLPLSLQRSCLLRLPWENVSTAAEGERWRGICCRGSEKSGRDSPKQITRIGVDAHTGWNSFLCNGVKIRHSGDKKNMYHRGDCSATEVGERVNQRRRDNELSPRARRE